MKKLLFSLLACLFVLTNANAQTTTIWEGYCQINWGESEVRLSCDTYGITEGTTIVVHYDLVEDAEYHAARVVTGPAWQYDIVEQFDLPSDSTGSYSFEIHNEAINNIYNDGGVILLEGYGYAVTKVTLEPAQSEQTNYSLYANDAVAVTGGTVDIPVYMKDNGDITAFEFEFSLPWGMYIEDVSLASDRVTKTEEGCSHELRYNRIGESYYKVLCTSPGNSLFTGTEGQVATLRVNVGENYGNYGFCLSDIQLAHTNTRCEYPSECRVIISIRDCALRVENEGQRVTELSNIVFACNEGLELRNADAQVRLYRDSLLVETATGRDLLATDSNYVWNLSKTYGEEDPGYYTLRADAGLFTLAGELESPVKEAYFDVVGSRKVYFVNSYNWQGDIYCLAYNYCSGNYKPYPGEMMTRLNEKIAGCDVYEYKVPAYDCNGEIRFYDIQNGEENHSYGIWYDYQADRYFYNGEWRDREYLDNLNYLVSVTPVEGTTVGLDAEFTFEFARPVDQYYFDVNFCGWNNANVWETGSNGALSCYQNEEGNVVTLKLNKDYILDNWDVEELYNREDSIVRVYYEVYNQNTGEYIYRGLYFTFDKTRNELYVNDYYELNDDVKLADKATVAVNSSPHGSAGHLTVSRSEPLDLGSFRFSYNPLNELVYNWSLHEGYRYSNVSATMVVDNTVVTADSTSVKMRISADSWYFISLPFNVNVGSVTNEGTHPWVIYTYSGENRASGEGATWQKKSNDDILKANEGFIIQASSYDENGSYNEEIIFTFPATYGTRNNIFSYEDKTTELGVYPSEFTHNAGWNFVANPFPAYYDTRSMSFTAPITTWNSDSRQYYAWSPVDDEYILAPGEAFFVQATAEQSEITFPAEGRQHECEAQERNYMPRRQKANMESRSVFNFYLAEADVAAEKVASDRTRLVINENASAAYDASEDASKFDPMSKDAIQLYVYDNGVKYAIDERPLSSGSVALGYSVAKDGNYTISLQTKAGEQVMLEDRVMNTQTLLNNGEYTFSASKGTDNSRFYVSVVGGTTEIDSVGAEAGSSRIYNISGQRVNDTKAAGVYVKDGRKVLK